MNSRTARILLLLSIFFCVHTNNANGTTLPAELNRLHLSGNVTHIDSFDFKIENIEYDDIFLGSITTLRKHDNGSFSLLNNGGQLIYTHNGVHVDVTNGYVALSFSGYAGLVVTFALAAGNSFDFEPESFIIGASAKNLKDVIVNFDGTDYFIPPGKRFQNVEVQIISDTKSYDIKPNIKGKTPIVIFGSAHLDVGNIDIESLYIENLAKTVIGKTHNLSTIIHFDDDEFPDLIVMFEDISHIFTKNINQTILSGYLTDGTIINGNPTL